MGAAEVTAFLTHLAREREVAAATQNQALSALLFLYGEVLEIKLPWMDGIERAKRPVRVPVVLTVEEVRALLARLDGTKWLMAGLLYGSGLRLRECLKLRVKDVDFEYRQITVRDGKGGKDRVTMLPQELVESLRSHLARVRSLHEHDLAEGYGTAELPFALARKYPNAASQWGWQYVFPSRKRSADPRSGEIRRHHVYDDVLPRAIGQAAREAGIAKPVGSHTLRHSFGHAPSCGRPRHPHRAGAPRTFGREHHHGVHARAQQRRAGRQQSAGQAEAARSGLCCPLRASPRGFS
jgi:integron integrase